MSQASLKVKPALVESTEYTSEEKMRAERNLVKLSDLINLDDDDFEKQLDALPSGDKALIHEVLGVSNRHQHGNNATLRVTAVRKAFRAYPGLLMLRGPEERVGPGARRFVRRGTRAFWLSAGSSTCWTPLQTPTNAKPTSPRSPPRRGSSRN
jgi:hypothetical protein